MLLVFFRASRAWCNSMQQRLNTFFNTHPVKTIRALEILFPMISLLLITLPFWGALLFPNILAVGIIAFDMYWLYKSLNLALCSYIATQKIKKAEKENWLEKAEKHEHYKDMHHVIVIPTYKESIEKLQVCIDSIAAQTFPTKRIHVFVAMEEREEEAPQKAELLRKAYKGVFGTLDFTFHVDREGEVKGKSSNEAFAGYEAERILVKEKKLDMDYMTISSVDADSIFDHQHFAYISDSFLSSKTPHLSFWQSANVTYNNFWQIPSFTRVIAFFGSLWRASLLVQGLRLVPNSTYTLSFKLLKEIGYWDTDVIPEDYRTFFKAFFAKEGKVSVIPVFLKTSMDAPQSPTYFSSLMNKYNQERRWSWGISDDAVYIKWWLTVKNMPFLKKTYLVGTVLFDHILWPVNWFIITVSANVIVLINPIFYRTSLGYNLPHLSGFILTLCLFSLFVMIYVDFDLRSKRYSDAPKFRQFMFPLEFVLMPVAGFFLSTLPALISHLQLIRGKRLEYKVTEKV
jgi:cellulose synthase/poly-beta-1,6-N-acetylglucosamine synthase-like glycosyltransferase